MKTRIKVVDQGKAVGFEAGGMITAWPGLAAKYPQEEANEKIKLLNKNAPNGRCFILDTEEAGDVQNSDN